MDKNEIWKAIPGYEGIYSASNLGRIKSHKFNSEHILKMHCSRGYLRVNLSANGIREIKRVHRLIATAFLGIPKNEQTDINHKNGKRDDNRIENLEWCTRSENVKHGYDILGRIALRGEKHGRSKLVAGDVLEIRKLHSTGNYKYQELSEIFRISKSQIRRIVKRIKWTHI